MTIDINPTLEACKSNHSAPLPERYFIVLIKAQQFDDLLKVVRAFPVRTLDRLLDVDETGRNLFHYIADLEKTPYKRVIEIFDTIRAAFVPFSFELVDRCLEAVSKNGETFYSIANKKGAEIGVELSGNTFRGGQYFYKTTRPAQPKPPIWPRFLRLFGATS